jgi:dipeptidyl aminopeptidase/acylaminoacyl peptidase
MTRHIGVGFGGLGLLLLAACGGTVDLEQGQGGGAGTAPTAGAGVGGVPGAAPTGGAAGSAPRGGAAGAGGDIGTGFPLPTAGALAYDLDRDGRGRAIYLHWFGEDCTQRLTDPELAAKQVTFSPDGSKLAFAGVVAGRYQIHVTTLATGDTEVVTSFAAGATSPTFSPQGDKLAYVTGDPELFANREPAAGDLVLLDLTSGDSTTLIDADLMGCCVAQALSPAFIGDKEIIFGTRMSMIAVDIDSGATRDVVPITGRIPNPQDPAPAPDGARYAYSDYCGGGLSLYIGRTDGLTGDTCESAKAVGGGSLISADWGKDGYLAAEIKDAPGGIVMIEEDTFLVAPLIDTLGGRNPAWAPEHVDLEPSCE